MKDSNPPISGGLANESNRGWWRSRVDMAAGRDRGTYTMKTTALRGLHFWKFSQGVIAIDWWAPGNDTVHWKSHNYELSLYIFFYLYEKACELLLLTQCFLGMVSYYGRCLLWGSKHLPWRKAQDLPSWGWSSSVKLGSPNFQAQRLRGVGALWQLSLSTLSVTKELFLTCWRTWRHASAGGVLLSWQILIQVYLKTSGSSLSLAEVYTFFSPELFLAQAIQGKEFEGYFVSEVGSL